MVIGNTTGETPMVIGNTTARYYFIGLHRRDAHATGLVARKHESRHVGARYVGAKHVGEKRKWSTKDRAANDPGSTEGVWLSVFTNKLSHRFQEILYQCSIASRSPKPAAPAAMSSGVRPIAPHIPEIFANTEPSVR